MLIAHSIVVERARRFVTTDWCIRLAVLMCTLLESSNDTSTFAPARHTWHWTFVFIDHSIIQYLRTRWQVGTPYPLYDAVLLERCHLFELDAYLRVGTLERDDNTMHPCAVDDLRSD